MKTRILFGITTMMLVALTSSVLLEAQEQDKQKQTHYRVQDLGTLGGTFSFPGGVNNRGEVEGLSTLPGDTTYHAFFWHGVMKDLGTLGGQNSFAQAHPSDRGQVGGNSETSAADPAGEDFCTFGTNLTCLPFVWQNSVLTPLPTLGGNNGWAYGFNNHGILVGIAENTTPDPTCEAPQVFQFKPVFWNTTEIEKVATSDGDSAALGRKGKRREIQRLPTFKGDPDGFGTAINSYGQAVGASGSCTNPTFHALLWERGTVIDLGNLGGTMNNVAYDINNRGQVVGVSNLAGDTISHAFFWQERVMRDLGTLPGDVTSLGEGIDIRGQVVGGSFDADGNSRAFLWKNGVMTDLNTLIPADSPLFLLEATASSAFRGYIVGLALQKSTGEVHAFLATPRQGERDDESATAKTFAATSESQKVSIPENARKMLQERRASGRFKGRLTRPK